ncbi:MAG: hypothetical protein WA864_09290 [Acetobacteraceae bacterium]
MTDIVTADAAGRRTGSTSETTDRANVIIHPPIASGIAFVRGLAMDRLYP